MLEFVFSLLGLVADAQTIELDGWGIGELTAPPWALEYSWSLGNGV